MGSDSRCQPLSLIRLSNVTDQPQQPKRHVTPLDVDAVRTVRIGTALWAVGLVAAIVFRDTLADNGRDWWVWTCVAGVLLGCAGIVITTRRRSRLARRSD
jgi:hypothetical protein